jgi:uncharacterized protein YjiS (DUF1127 family)
MLLRDQQPVLRSFRVRCLSGVGPERVLRRARWQYLRMLGRYLMAGGLLGSGRAPVGLVRAIGAVLEPVRRKLRCRAGARRMMELDDRLLKDIGIRRSEIQAAAYGLLEVDRLSRGPLDARPEAPVCLMPGTPCARPLAAGGREWPQPVETAPLRFSQRANERRAS